VLKVPFRLRVKLSVILTCENVTTLRKIVKTIK